MIVGRKDLVERISADLMVSRKSVDRVLVRLFRLIPELVHCGEIVRILKFGQFFARHTRAMHARSIHTGEFQTIPERNLFAFRASEMIKACDKPAAAADPAVEPAASTD